MARQRMIKPEIWIDEGFLSLSIPARLLFVGMISGADDAGRGLATDRCLKAHVFPGDDITLEQIRGLRIEMSTNVNIRFYEVDGKEYYQLLKWQDHQKVDHPSKSTVPAPREDAGISTGNVPDQSGTPRANELTNELTNESNKSMSIVRREYAQGVSLKQTEYQDLVAKYGEEKVKLAIEKVSAQQIKTCKAYKNPVGAILQWGIRAADEELQRARKTGVKDTRASGPPPTTMEQLRAEREAQEADPANVEKVERDAAELRKRIGSTKVDAPEPPEVELDVF